MFGIVAATSSSGSPVGGIIGLIVGIAIIVAFWRVFSKAGQPGWAAIIPIFNYVVMLRLVGKPWWWVFGFFIPLVNFALIIWLFFSIPKTFGKSTGFCVASIFLFPIMVLILGFSDAQYQGPQGSSGNVSYTPARA